MELQDRCRGLMVGLAVGNLLGLACEGWERGEIRRHWPDGIRDVEAEPGCPDDDDLAQAIVLAEACVDAEVLDADDLARRFWVWGEENGLGMGRPPDGVAVVGRQAAHECRLACRQRR